jgi:hypothetical protein
MGCVGKCGIYEERPNFCKEYPKVIDFVPPRCTFHFIGEERRGSCQPEACGQDLCCTYPRDGGEPEGTSLDAMAGGAPCKHLQWTETSPPKEASAEGVPCVEMEIAQLLNTIIGDL